jgi:hypothetical protein
MKRKEATVHMTISIPRALKDQMEGHRQINWSVVASAAFQRRLKVEEVLSKFEEPGISEEEAIKRGLSIERRLTSQVDTS